MDPFWTTVFAVWFALIVVVVVTRGYREFVYFQNVRRIAERERSHPTPTGEQVMGESAYLTEMPPPPPPTYARPGACPCCGNKWDLPGPVSGTLTAPVPGYFPGNPCHLCGRALPSVAGSAEPVGPPPDPS